MTTTPPSENDEQAVEELSDPTMKNSFAPVYIAGPADHDGDLVWRNTVINEYDDIWWVDPAVEIVEPFDITDPNSRLIDDHKQFIDRSTAILAGWDPFVDNTEQTVTEMMYAHIAWTPIILWMRGDPAMINPWVKHHATFGSENLDECVDYIERVVINGEDTTGEDA